jgi:hypothetical protein
MTFDLSFAKHILDALLIVGVVTIFLISWVARMNASRE